MFNLVEYRRRPGWLPDYLPWAGIVHPGVMLNKDGGFMRTLAYRGPDTDSATDNELVGYSNRLNNLLRRFGQNWCLHIDGDHRASVNYPTSEWPVESSALIDEERRQDFESVGRHYETDYYLTLTYMPPTESSQKFSDFMFEKRPGDKGINYQSHLDNFVRETDDFFSLYSDVVAETRWLDNDELLTYLHATVSTRRHLVRCPENPFYLDALLADCELDPGLAPTLGGHHLRVISIRSFPDTSTPALLEKLNSIPIAFRWSTRWLPMDKEDAKKAMKRIRKRWFSQRKSMFSIVTAASSKDGDGGSKLEDPEATNKAKDASDALAQLGRGAVSYGYMTTTVVVMDEDERIVEDKVRAIQKAIDNEGFVSKTETWNAVQAWLGSLPGHLHANVRRPVLSSRNLVHLMPASAIWAGPAEDRHLGGPPLLMAKARGNTPFRLSTHQGELGHAWLIGPPRAGKSFKLALMRNQFMRYKDAQLRVYDKGGSSRADTLAAGGQFYDLGDPKGIGFQPLADIDNEAELLWANEWVQALYVEQGLVVTPQIKEDLLRSLRILADKPRESRTLTGLWLLVQAPDAKRALQPYTMAGAYGYLLDRAEDGLTNADWQSYELEKLFKQPSIIVPVLAYLFHRDERCFTGRPMMIQLDEAWQFLDRPIFVATIRDWLKAMPKKKVHVIFSTQSLTDSKDSPIFPVLIECCPTRIYLPNESAQDKAIFSFYESVGLNRRQIQIIAEATPKRDYYVQSGKDSRLYELGAGPITRALCGSGTLEDHALMDKMIAEGGTGDFMRRFLRIKKVELKEAA